MCAPRYVKSTEELWCMCAGWWCVVLCGVLCMAVSCAVCLGCSGVSCVYGSVLGVRVSIIA